MTAQASRFWTPAPFGDAAPARRALPTRALVGLLVVLGALGSFSPEIAVTLHYLWLQDVPVATLLIVLMVAPFSPVGLSRIARLPLPSVALGRRHLVAAVLGTVLVGALGHHALFAGYALSPDEQRVLMDAHVFASGALTAPAPVTDAPLETIRPSLMRVSEDGDRWISVYLPGNAALHALGLKAGAPWLVAPVLAGLALFATVGCARQLWPEDRLAGPVAGVFLLTSVQFLATAMTPFAMTAHLAFNMIWLWLFLKNRPWSHAGAVVLGLFALGLHQYVFHALFAGPILALLLWRRRWGIAALYAGAYAAGLLFWLAYPGLVIDEGPSGIQGGFFEHLFSLLAEGWRLAPTMMAANLLRLVTWQNAVWLPFAALGLVAIAQGRRAEEVALIAAFVALPVVAAAVLPNQGMGWGYRYMHGLLGLGALFAARGYRALSARLPAARILAVGTIATLVLSSPYLLATASQMTRAFAAADRAVTALGPGAVVIEAKGLLGSLVRNGPGAEEQIRLRSTALSEDHPCAAPPESVDDVTHSSLLGGAPLAWRCPSVLAEAAFQGGTR